jgi:predicted RNA binding protein YcfA (HicA-like mRNA interferase family)
VNKRQAEKLLTDNGFEKVRDKKHPVYEDRFGSRIMLPSAGGEISFGLETRIKLQVKRAVLMREGKLETAKKIELFEKRLDNRPFNALKMPNLMRNNFNPRASTPTKQIIHPKDPPIPVVPKPIAKEESMKPNMELVEKKNEERKRKPYRKYVAAERMEVWRRIKELYLMGMHNAEITKKNDRRKISRTCWNRIQARTRNFGATFDDRLGHDTAT